MAAAGISPDNLQHVRYSESDASRVRTPFGVDSPEGLLLDKLILGVHFRGHWFEFATSVSGLS
jgi:hypothetical protein